MSNRAKFRNIDRRLQQERAAANRAANPEKYARDPNKRQMGRAAAKARMEAEAEAENKNKPANPEVTNDFKRQAKQGAAEELPGNLRYPYSAIDNTQDFIKFSVFKYKNFVAVQSKDIIKKFNSGSEKFYFLIAHKSNFFMCKMWKEKQSSTTFNFSLLF